MTRWHAGLWLGMWCSACAANKGSVANPLVLEPLAGRAASASAQPAHAAGGFGAEAAAPPQPQMVAAASPAAAGAPAAKPALPLPGAAGSTAPLTAADAQAARPSAAAGAASSAGASAAVGGALAPAPSGSAGTTAGAAPAAGAAAVAPPAGPTSCKMTVEYTCVGSHGMWYPHNIGAVWVEDPSGKFIKTIERWASIRAPYLAAWNMREEQHGKWPSCSFGRCTGMMVPDQVDVKTQATIFEDNQKHTATWSCKDLKGAVVPDGHYKLFIEEMENIYPTFPAGPLASVDFEKGPMPTTWMPANQSPFSGLKITIEPTAP